MWITRLLGHGQTRGFLTLTNLDVQIPTSPIEALHTYILLGGLSVLSESSGFTSGITLPLKICIDWYIHINGFFII